MTALIGWWFLAMVSFAAVLLMWPRYAEALMAPRPFLTVSMGSGETVRLLVDDSDFVISVSWEYRQGAVRASGGLGSASDPTSLRDIPFKILRLDPSTIIIVDPSRNQLLTAIDTSVVPPVEIDATANPTRLSAVARDAAAFLGSPFEPLSDQRVRGGLRR
ncbi:MAG TPA: hypothetical protein VF777_16015 [Phycisphaerales bacterium]